MTNKMMEQQFHASLVMDEAMKRAYEEGLITHQIHDSILCKAEDAERIDQIFKEVQHDFKRTKAMVAKS